MTIFLTVYILIGIVVWFMSWQFFLEEFSGDSLATHVAASYFGFLCGLVWLVLLPFFLFGLISNQIYNKE